VTRLDALEGVLAQAKAEGRPALVDFYADWCVACKEMDRETFGDSTVRAALANWRLIRVDITQNSAEDRRFLERYRLIGPPAVIILGPDGEERRSLRIIGFMAPDAFLKNLARL
jgi:thiol:disulfide interchange protein DsbD